MWIEPNDAGLLAAELLLERCDRAGHDHDLVLQAPARIQGARDAVRRLDIEVEVPDPVFPKRGQHLAHELRADPAAARVARDVEVCERPEPGRSAAREREADRRPVVLGDERDLGLDDLAHLSELLLHVGRALVGRWRDLVVELPPQIRDRLEVLGCRTPHVHAAPSLPSARLRGGTVRTGSRTARTARSCDGPPGSTVRGRQRRTSRPPCARRGRRPARRAAGRGGARGTNPRSSGRALEPTSRAAMTSSSSRAASPSRSRSEWASSRTYSAFAREKPRGVKCRGRSSLIRSRVGNSQADVVPDAVTLDEVATDGRCRVQRDLLRRDRDHERLEGLRVQVGRKPGTDSSTRVRVSSPAAHSRNASRSNGRPRRSPTSAAASSLQGSIATPSSHGCDPHLATRDDAMQPSVVPHGRAVRSEIAEARRRELEVVRLGDPQQHAADVTQAPSRTSASSGRAARISIAWLHPSGTTQAGSPSRVTCSGSRPSGVCRASAYSSDARWPASSPA